MENSKALWLTSKPIAHRGLHDELTPENSLEAFENAIKKNFAIELDLHMLSDGTIVVFHDYNLKRMCGVDVELECLTKYNLPNYKLLETNHEIPTLEKVLETVAGRVPILIEFKSPEKDTRLMAENANKILSKYDGYYAIESFNPFILRWYKLNNPDVPRGQLSSIEHNAKINFIKRAILKRLNSNKYTSPDFFCCNISDFPNKFISKENQTILGWTIKTQSDYVDALKHCDNVIFDCFIPQEPN